MRLCPPWRSPPAPGDTVCTGLRPADDSGKTGSLSAAAHSALLVVQRLDVCTCVDLHFSAWMYARVWICICINLSICLFACV